MKIKFKYQGKNYKANLKKPLDISIPLIPGAEGPNCFWAPRFETSPVRAGDFVGSIEEGGLLNFKNVRLNPHGNGTHTECVGHILDGPYYINETLNNFHFIAKVISILPQLLQNGDKIITKEIIKDGIEEDDVEALIIRTIPNSSDKLMKVYSGTNPTYLDPEAMKYIVSKGVKHFIIDLPSVDREEDGGALASHNIFWNTDGKIAKQKTITEMVYVPDQIKDGLYLLNIQIASFMMDASPSKLVLYKIK